MPSALTSWIGSRWMPFLGTTTKSEKESTIGWRAERLRSSCPALVAFFVISSPCAQVSLLNLVFAKREASRRAGRLFDGLEPALQCRHARVRARLSLADLDIERLLVARPA